jgi:hypothetical protein
MIFSTSHINKYQWHQWFAWYPVVVGQHSIKIKKKYKSKIYTKTDWIWFKTILRHGYICGDDTQYWRKRMGDSGKGF